LADATHSFTATASDAAGNVSAASSTALNVTVDTGAPNAPTISSFSTDSGTVGDNITNDNTLSFTGTAAAGSTVSIYDGATLLGTATANGSGAWTFTTGTLADATHSFSARASDAAGNISANSTTLSITIDTTTPSAPTIASFSTDSGTVGDGITNDNTLTLTGAAAAGSTVSIYDGTTLIGTAIANGSGAWTFTTGTLADATHSFTGRASDTAGNVSAASTALSVTVDTVAPGAPAIASFSSDSGTVGDGITNDKTLLLSGTAAAGSIVSIYDGATLLGSALASGSGVWTYTTGALADGPHSLTTRASDAAGNVSAASTAVGVTVDTSTPNAPTISASTISALSSAGATVTLTGLTEAGAMVSVYAMHNAKGAGGATLLGTATADANGVWSFATAAQSGTALHFTATATDVAGNVGASSATYNMTVISTTSDSPLVEPSLTNGGDNTGMGDTPLFHEHRDGWSAIHDHHPAASDREGMGASYHFNGADSQDGLWHDAVGPSSPQGQPGHAEILEANALPAANVGSTQKELFSLVTDLGWAGIGNPDGRMVDGEPGAFLEHDRVASFNVAHAPNGDAFLL
jgi:hypothetical protein